MIKVKGFLFILFIASVLGSSCKKGNTYDAEKQLEIDEQLIKNFLTANNITNAFRDESGVYYIITAPGSGNFVYQNNTLVKVKYAGRLLNGQVFDSSESFEYPLGNLITGWIIGISKIQKGGKIRLLIPSFYAYGPNPNGGIPSNSVLDFDIELLDVK